MPRQKKARYDQFGFAGVDPNYGAGQGAGGFGGGFGGGFDGDIDLGDIFSSFFGGGFGTSSRNPNAPSRGRDIQASVTLTFEEAAKGCKKTIEVMRVMDCSECGGTGAAKGTSPTVCPECHGSGVQTVSQRTPLGVMSTQRTCSRCGGNTAMDACRTAVRLGAKEVYVIYRRTEKEMPAEEIEIKESKEEGVTYKFLTNPLEIHSQNGKVSGMTLQLMELGEPDASGRRRPVAIDGKTEYLELDSVIMAIGQKLDGKDFENTVELTQRGTIAADEDTFLTNLDGVFAIGDATNKGASIAIAAIGEADRCVKVVDAYLNGEKLDFNEPYISKRDEDKIDFSGNDKKAQIVAEVLPAEKRKACFDEVSLGLTVEQAQKEAERCLECGCREYFKCKLLNVAQRYEIHPERFAGEMPQKYTKDSNSFIERNTAKCILCGLCVRSCREVEQLSVLGLLGRGFKTSVAPAFALPLDQTKCTNCGLCVSLCPTGALTEKSNLKKQVPLAEKYSLETLEIDGKKCDYLVSRYDGKILRAVPHNENARKCALEREDVISKLS